MAIYCQNTPIVAQKMGVLPPGVTRQGVTPQGDGNFFNGLKSYFEKNLGLR